MSLDRSKRRNAAWNVLSLVAFAGVASHFVACGTSETVDGTSGPTAAVTNGTGYDPICEGGMRDGFCNALGAKPESCMCLDCAQTAYCKQMCKNDGTCNQGAGEDCTCIDCIGQSVNGNDCQLVPMNGNNGPGPTAAATTTTNNSASATTADTTAASTAAATTAASTAASTSTGM